MELITTIKIYNSNLFLSGAINVRYITIVDVLFVPHCAWLVKSSKIIYYQQLIIEDGNNFRLILNYFRKGKLFHSRNKIKLQFTRNLSF